MSKQKTIKYGDYENKTDKQLNDLHEKIFDILDGYLEKKHKKASLDERIEIRTIQYNILQLCEVERELTLRENQ